MTRTAPAAARIGAVNTVMVGQDGLLGDNTDGYGFIASLGTIGQPPLEVDLAPLPVAALVADIVYNPLETGLLARGHVVVDGLGMLMHQVRPGFRAWFGIDPEVTDAQRATVLAGLG